MGIRCKPALVLVLLMAAGCEFPRDAAGTLDRVHRDGVLRVGYSVQSPWVEEAGDRPTGVEPRLIEGFAATLGVSVHWTRAAQPSIVEALRRRHIDVAIGGFERNSPWEDRAAATQPFIRTSLIVAVPDERQASGFDPENETIAHPRQRPDLAALIAEKGARPQAADDLAGRVAVVYDFEAGRLGLKPTGIRLDTREQVMLVAQGESRLLYELDLFLASAARESVAAPGAIRGGRR